MKKAITIILLALINTLSYSQTNNESPELETISIFEVQVGSNKYIVEEGNELNIDGKLKNPKISIKLLEIKKFNVESISFEYPSNFSFEVDKSEGYKNWALDGNDYVVMIFDIDGESQVKDFIDSMIDQFGENKCITKEIETKLGEKILSGIQLYVELVGEKITIDFYQYSTSENNSKYISFQDTLDENSKPSKESIISFNIIDKSVKFK